MSDGAVPPDPPRLELEEGELSRLLETAEAEYRENLDESAAFRRIERTRRRRTLMAAGGVLAAAAAAILFLAPRLAPRADSDSFAVRPEPVTPPAVDGPATPARTAAPEVAPALPRAPVEGPRVESSQAQSSPALSLASSDVAPTEEGCRKLVASKKTERAVECYRALGRAASVSGEVALYNAAQVSFDGLGDAARTLALLDEHRQRFPASALRGEVDWLRVRGLERARRFDEALAVSEALLESPSNRALASDLHWLRARIYQDQRGDCERAVSELVSLVGESGERGDAAELRRARCLEKLGRSTDARAAYQRYLERPDARHGDEARERLSNLPE